MAMLLFLYHFMHSSFLYPAYSNLELSSHPYDFPSLTKSMKLEQRELESSTKEHVYDYARVRVVHALERSEYVVSIKVHP